MTVASDTYLDHRLLVCNTPSRFLRVVIDGYNRVKVRRVRICLSASALFMLNLRLKHEFHGFQLCVELGNHTKRLLLSWRIPASAIGSVLSSFNLCLYLLFFFRVGESPRGRRSSRNA